MNHFQALVDEIEKMTRAGILQRKSSYNQPDIYCPHCAEINEKPDNLTRKDLEKTTDMDCKSCGKTFYLKAEIRYSTKTEL